MRSGDVLAARFAVEREAGRGGMGIVLRAHDLVDDRPVAIKLLAGSEQEDRARFVREAAVLRGLRHPAIVGWIADGFDELGRPYLVTDWIEGEALSARLRRGPLTVAETLLAGRRIATALAAAHAAGIVHRDLKPDNLLLPGGRLEDLVLVDFGIARVGGPSRTLTIPGSVIGTPGYMAPEQARGAETIDARADVFALGSVLWECLAGRPAFETRDRLAVLLRVLLEQVPRLDRVVPDVPPALSTLVARLLAKEPAARPADGAAVVRALDELEGLRSGAEETAASTLTTDELRVVSVVLAREPFEPGTAGQTVWSPSGPDAGRILGEIRELVRQHGGRLEVLVVGSLVATVYGSPTATDLAVRAGRLALALRQQLRGWGLSVAMGRGDTREPRAVGEAIDRAVAQPLSAGEIRVDDLSAGLLADRFDVLPAAGGWSLEGERAAEGPERTVLGRATPFVGRDAELGRILGAIEACAREARPVVVGVVGVAGSGKSRLQEEVTRQLPAGVEALVARGDALRADAPFAMLAPALRRAAGVSDAEPLEVRRQRLCASVGSAVAPAEVARVAALLGEIAGVPFDPEDVAALRAVARDPVQKGDAMRRAFVEWLGARCAAHPVLLVLDDLQWGDAATVRCVAEALRVLRGSALCVVTLGRPEVDARFPAPWPAELVTRLGLGRLDTNAAERLVLAMAPTGVAPPMLARLVEGGAGNPLLLEELVRAMARGAGEATDRSVAALLGARLETRSPDERRVLRAASIFGRSFWRAGVAALLGAEPDGDWLSALLARLAVDELAAPCDESRFAGEVEYRFRHDLLCDAAYASLTESDRALGHGLAGAWLEERGEPDAAVLAEHFGRGGARERATVALAAAARKALEGYDLAAAVQHATRGLSWEPPDPLRGALASVLAEAAIWRGEFREAFARAGEAMSLLPPGSAGWYEAVGRRAASAVRAGGIADLDRLATGVLDAVPEDLGSALLATARLLERSLRAGQLARAPQLLALLEAPEARALAGREPALAAAIEFARATATLLLAGDLVAGVEGLERACARFGDVGQELSALEGHAQLAHAWSELGQIERALRHVRAARTICDRIGSHVIVGFLDLQEAEALRRRGQSAAAIVWVERALERIHEQGDRRLEALARVFIAELLADTGSFEPAAVPVETALRTLAPFPGPRAWAEAVLARVELGRGRLSRALALSEGAFAQVEEVGALTEEETTIRLSRAEALAAAGRAAEARGVLAAAWARVQERAERIGDPALRESFLANVPGNARARALARLWLGA